jgi:hypothetical protein
MYVVGIWLGIDGKFNLHIQLILYYLSPLYQHPSLQQCSKNLTPLHLSAKRVKSVHVSVYHHLHISPASEVLECHAYVNDHPKIIFRSIEALQGAIRVNRTKLRPIQVHSVSCQYGVSSHYRDGGE